MASKQHLVLVCDGDDELAGFFLGICEPHFVLKGKYATDLTFHALPAYPGVGVAMARRFLSWARARRDVALIIMGISNDMVDEQRLGRFYERQGLKRMGGLYLQITGVTL